MFHDHDMEFEVLKGQTIVKIKGDIGDDEMTFETEEGNTYQMYHSQNCCESVALEEIVGSLADIMGAEIVEAEKVTFDNVNPEGVKIPEYQDVFEWTFYKLRTSKGCVTLRWMGDSNGYYSTDVDFRRVGGDDDE